MNTIFKQYLPDGAFMAVMPDFSWDITLANGRHQRGKASSQADAIAKMKEAYHAFVLSAWYRGAPTTVASKHKFVVPLD